MMYMITRLFFVFGILVPSLLFAQNGVLHVSAFGGISNYTGELNSTSFRLPYSKAAGGIGVRYDYSGHLGAQFNMLYTKLSAQDSTNVTNTAVRNLHFASNIFEANLLVQFNIINFWEHRFSPYIFAGVGYFHMNPYTYAPSGEKVYLRPLSTEGQGLSQYPDRKPYSKHQLNIPFGGGLQYRISDKVTIAYEFGLRKLFTDYIDDVSQRYVDGNVLLAEKGALAYQLSYRGGELPGGDPTYPTEGTVRGSENTNDWYYVHGIKLFITLADVMGGRGKGIPCPPAFRR